jgi:membrane protease YdiL (CAAX protease family)
VTADDLLQFLLERRNFILIGIFDDCALLILVALELWRPVVRVPGNQRTVVPRSLGRAVGLACAGILITVVVQRLFNSTASATRISQAAQELGPHSLGRLLWQAWLVLVAPVSEELYFRKLLFTLYKSVSGRTVALCLQALAFVAMHGQMTGQLASIAVAALVLGMIYEATGAILLPMLVHSLLNLLAVLRMA